MELNINAAQNFYKGANQVDKLYLKGQLIYPTYALEYFNITPKRNDQISFSGSDLQYSFDLVNWDNVSGAISVSRGQKVYFKGNCTPQQNSGIGGFNSTSAYGFDVSGNIMSLLFGDNFIGQTSLVGYDYAFSSLFAYSYVVDCSRLILPATILSSQCYRYMFSNCSSLTTAPELPATILAGSCYAGMFENCTSLTTSPALPATTFQDYNGSVAYDVYKGMFGGCSSLATAPLLPATTISGGCYESMFQGCSSLTSAPALPATTLAWNCYAYMFNNCTSLVNAPQLPTMTLCNRCYEGMFRYCTSLTTAPNLPATVVGVSCYAYMFENCTSLVNAPSLPALELKGPYNDVANDCYRNMFYNCTSLVTPPSLPATSLAGSCYCNMFKGCTSLTSVPTIAATTLTDMNGNPTWWDFSGMFSGCTSLTTVPTNYLPALNVFNGCYSWMFENCTSLTQVPDLPANNVWDEGYEDMFVGCTSLVNAPSISATFIAQSAFREMFGGCSALVNAPVLHPTTLARGCYCIMFKGCTSLVTAPDLPATTLVDSCYSAMFEGCTSLTTAPDLPATTLAGYCYQGMFKGCTSLNYIKCSATDISATGCTDNWVANVANSGTFVKYPTMSSWTTGTSGIPVGWDVEDIDLYTTEYFTVEPLGNGTITFSKSGLEYSTDKINWSSLGTSALSVNEGTNVYLKGTMIPDNTDGIGTLYSTNDINVSGNAMSLLFGDNFIDQTSLSGYDYAFKNLFKRHNISYLLRAQNLKLPATTLSAGCYQGMFNNCESLIVGPKLPATTLTAVCYSTMFAGCSSLAVAPDLPATTLSTSCYSQMFYHCKSLTSAPDLPATTLVNRCYYQMFTGCTSLEYIECLATDISATDCINSWVQNVATRGTFVTDFNNTSWDIGDNGKPEYWKRQDLINGQPVDYNSLYTTIEAIESTTITPEKGNYYYSSDNGTTWTGLSANVSFTVPAHTRIILKRHVTMQSYGIGRFAQNATGKFIVFGNSLSLLWGDDFAGKTVFANNDTYNLHQLWAYATALWDAYNFKLPSLVMRDNCYSGMFMGATSLRVAPKELPATTLFTRCYQGMFNGASKLLESPIIAAASTANISQPIYEMFRNCYVLSKITCLLDTSGGLDGSNYFTSNVASSGTFIKNPVSNNWSRGQSGIPLNWTVIDYSA